MKLISQVILDRKPNLKKSERAQVISEIYDLIVSAQEKKLRKIENWRRYLIWCHGKNPQNPESIKKFKKNPLFIRELSIRSFCVLISHIQTKDLYYILSIAKDRSARQQSVSAWLISEIKK